MMYKFDVFTNGYAKLIQIFVYKGHVSRFFRPFPFLTA